MQPLHEGLLDFHRITENDDVAALDFGIRKNMFRNGARGRIGQFIHQQMVADEQRVFHRSGGDDESLHQVRGAEQEQDDGDGPFRNETARRFRRRVIGPFRRLFVRH